jgi:hypothetical protein
VVHAARRSCALLALSAPGFRANLSGQKKSRSGTSSCEYRERIADHRRKAVGDRFFDPFV